MKKLIIIAVSLLTLSACNKKSSTSTTPGGSTSSSTFNITLAGHTYNLVYNTAYTPMTASTTSETGDFIANGYFLNTLGNTPGFDFQVFAADETAGSSTPLHINALIKGYKVGPSSALGVYRTGLGGPDAADGVIEVIEIIDQGDGGKVYEGCDTNSTITVSVSNATEIKGTFSLNLYYNNSFSTIYPCTGNFDIFK